MAFLYMDDYGKKQGCNKKQMICRNPDGANLTKRFLASLRNDKFRQGGWERRGIVMREPPPLLTSSGFLASLRNDKLRQGGWGRRGIVMREPPPLPTSSGFLASLRNDKLTPTPCHPAAPARDPSELPLQLEEALAAQQGIRQHYFCRWKRLWQHQQGICQH